MTGTVKQKFLWAFMCLYVCKEEWRNKDVSLEQFFKAYIFGTGFLLKKYTSESKFFAHLFSFGKKKSCELPYL